MPLILILGIIVQVPGGSSIAKEWTPSCTSAHAFSIPFTWTPLGTTPEKRGCHRWIEIKQEPTTIFFKKSNAWHVLSCLGKRPSRGKRFCSLFLWVWTAGKPVTAMEGHGFSGKGADIRVCVWWDPHEFYWNLLLAWIPMFLAAIPSQTIRVPVKNSDLTDIIHVYPSISSKSGCTWLRGARTFFSLVGSTQENKFQGNEQCCELFGDLACPLFGRSLLGPDLTKPSAHWDVDSCTQMFQKKS